jgi:uncharacterized small protein (DUF1192 family)
MKDTVTNKTLTVWSGFQGAVARYLSQRAATAEEALGGPYASPNAQTHVEALNKLRKHVETVDPGEQSMWSLREIQGMVSGDTDEFTPGPSQENFFVQFGMSVDKNPLPHDALAELVSCGIEDYRAKYSHLNNRLQQATARAERVPEIEARIAELQEELDNTRAEVVAAKADAEQESRNAAYLRSLLPGVSNGEAPPGPDRSGGAEPIPRKQEPPRRRAVEGFPGVYLTGAGKLEINYRQKGKTKWKTLGSANEVTFEDAAAIREQLTEAKKEKVSR